MLLVYNCCWCTFLPSGWQVGLFHLLCRYCAVQWRTLHVKPQSLKDKLIITHNHKADKSAGFQYWGKTELSRYNEHRVLNCDVAKTAAKNRERIKIGCHLYSEAEEKGVCRSSYENVLFVFTANWMLWKSITNWTKHETGTDLSVWVLFNVLLISQNESLSTGHTHKVDMMTLCIKCAHPAYCYNADPLNCAHPGYYYNADPLNCAHQAYCCSADPLNCAQPAYCCSADPLNCVHPAYCCSVDSVKTCTKSLLL